jgi:hypothetical protein
LATLNNTQLLCQLFSACTDYSILRHALLLCMAALLLCKTNMAPQGAMQLEIKKAQAAFSTWPWRV